MSLLVKDTHQYIYIQNQHTQGIKTLDLAEPTEYKLRRPLFWLRPEELGSNTDNSCFSVAPGVWGNLSKHKAYSLQINSPESGRILG